MNNKLRFLNISVFLQTQLYLLPFLFLFYQHCGLSVGDFFLFQGVFSIACLLFEIPLGYLGDIFPKRNVLMLSYTFFILRCLLWLFFAQYGYWVLLAGEILYAAQRASFTGVSDSYIYEYLKRYNISQKMKKRYGKMNFFMSMGNAISSLIGAGIYVVVSQYTLAKYNYNYAFMALIGLELILNLIATLLLFRLPNLPQQAHPQKTLKETYTNIFHCVILTMRNQNIKNHILYSGLLTATTSIFVWSFQPIMKLLLIPSLMYGFVYFINHIVRAIASLCSDKISHLISLSKMALLIFVGFVSCFIITFIVLNSPHVSVEMGLLYFIFISLVIGMQLAFRILHDCRLHTFVPSQMRSTSSSVSSMVNRLYAGFFFVLMKILLDDVSIQKSLIVCFIVFIAAAWPLKKVYAIQSQQEKMNQ